MLNKRNVFTRFLKENLRGNLRTEEERQGNRFEDKINLWKSKKKKKEKGEWKRERCDAHATYGSLAVNLTGVYLNLRSRLWPAACTGIMYGRMNMHRTRYELRPPPPRETRTRDDPLLCSALLTLRFHEPPLFTCLLFNTRFKVCAAARRRRKRKGNLLEETTRERLDSNGKRR